MKIGDILKDLRINNNATQQTVADNVGISRSVLSQYENNLVEPTANVVKKIATYFDVSADYLLGLEDDFGARVPAVPATTAAVMSDAMTEKERAMLEAFRQLLPETQDFILRSAQSLRDKKSVT